MALQAPFPSHAYGQERERENCQRCNIITSRLARLVDTWSRLRRQYSAKGTCFPPVPGTCFPLTDSTAPPLSLLQLTRLLPFSLSLLLYHLVGVLVAASLLLAVPYPSIVEFDALLLKLFASKLVVVLSCPSLYYCLIRVSNGALRHLPCPPARRSSHSSPT